MSAREEANRRLRLKVEADKSLPASQYVRNMLHATHSHAEADAKLESLRAELRAEIRAEVLNEAAEVAVRAARACGDSETGQYAASVAACIGKELRRLAAASPRTVADEQPETAVEFGVRAPSGVLTPTHDRAEAERRLARTQYPDAGLVQRTVSYGPWTEVAR